VASHLSARRQPCRPSTNESSGSAAGCVSYRAPCRNAAAQAAQPLNNATERLGAVDGVNTSRCAVQPNPCRLQRGVGRAERLRPRSEPSAVAGLPRGGLMAPEIRGDQTQDKYQRA
jgi:hypothetical protein